MCRPPDVLTQFTEAERRSQLAALLFNGDESYTTGGTEWEDQGDEGAAQAEAMWNWQQVAASGMPPGLQNTRQFTSTGMKQSTNMMKAEQARKAVRQVRTRPLDAQSGLAGPAGNVAFPAGREQAAWQAQLPRAARQAPTLSPWGPAASMPMGQPAPPSMQSSQNPSALNGPSMAGPAGSAMLAQMRMTGRQQTAWSRQADGTENLEQWLQSSAPTGPAAGVQFAAKGLNGASPIMSAQMQHWNLCRDGFDPCSRDNRLAMVGDAIDMDDEEDDDGDPSNDKKIRRMLSNRASAKRSRQRRQERLGELEIQTAKLRVENTAVTRKYHDALEQARRYQDENQKLRQELERVRSELDGLKMGKSAGLISVKEESGKTSVHSAAAARGPTKDELHNEAHSKRVPQKLQVKVNIVEDLDDDDCDTKMSAPASLIKPVFPNQSAGSKLQFSAPVRPVETVKIEDWSNEMPQTFENGFIGSPASGVTSGSDFSMPAVPAGDSINVCDPDGLGLPSLDTGILGADALGDEWFESLVQCMGE